MEDRIKILWLDIVPYQPLRGGPYIPLPAEERNKKAVISVKNRDDHCLRRALRSAMFLAARDPQRPSTYRTHDGLDFVGRDALTSVSQVLKIEKQNDMAICVFC